MDATQIIREITETFLPLFAIPHPSGQEPGAVHPLGGPPAQPRQHGGGRRPLEPPLRLPCHSRSGIRPAGLLPGASGHTHCACRRQHPLPCPGRPPGRRRLLPSGRRQPAGHHRRPLAAPTALRPRPCACAADHRRRASHDRRAKHGPSLAG